MSKYKSVSLYLMHRIRKCLKNDNLCHKQHFHNAANEVQKPWTLVISPNSVKYLVITCKVQSSSPAGKKKAVQTQDRLRSERMILVPHANERLDCFAMLQETM